MPDIVHGGPECGGGGPHHHQGAVGQPQQALPAPGGRGGEHGPRAGRAGQVRPAIQLTYCSPNLAFIRRVTTFVMSNLFSVLNVLQPLQQMSACSGTAGLLKRLTNLFSWAIK